MTPYAKGNSKCEVERDIERNRKERGVGIETVIIPVNPVVSCWFSSGILGGGGPSNHRVQWINIGPLKWIKLIQWIKIGPNSCRGSLTLSFATDAESVATLGDRMQSSSGRPQK